ncbi:unnamed protein product [Acanthoscelides obtectus]|uniref:Uncharacterized protein n=1 Tax=Acanthoscelides obtectus TaxID=200917 RepID=A0A9P0MG09_ACAOB|nr:unnamed protein product [Acanthoscelides obtectus]CAK1657503.1 hypothetical protein AOBTE_LOCUS20374 [Acanthoscelides obtectus]
MCDKCAKLTKQQLKDYHWVTSPLFFITAEILWGKNLV